MSSSGAPAIRRGPGAHGRLWALARTAGFAALAQLVEQLSCKQQVIGSSPIGGSNAKWPRIWQKSGRGRSRIGLDRGGRTHRYAHRYPESDERGAAPSRSRDAGPDVRHSSGVLWVVCARFGRMCPVPSGCGAVSGVLWVVCARFGRMCPVPSGCGAVSGVLWVVCARFRRMRPVPSGCGSRRTREKAKKRKGRVESGVDCASMPPTTHRTVLLHTTDRAAVGSVGVSKEIPSARKGDALGERGVRTKGSGEEVGTP